MERSRMTGFLLGLVAVLATCYVVLEWNSVEQDDGIAPLDLSDMIHESELVSMADAVVTERDKQARQEEPEGQLNIVDDDVELPDTVENVNVGDAGSEDMTTQKELLADDDAGKAKDADAQNPLNFRIVEDLPQFPGGAVELMKWLTKNLRYPPEARQKKLEGKVVAVFYVEKDGTITGQKIVKSLSAECDREVLRVLGMMPTWKPGIENDAPCRTKVCIPVVFKR